MLLRYFLKYKYDSDFFTFRSLNIVFDAFAMVANLFTEWLSANWTVQIDTSN